MSKPARSFRLDPHLLEKATQLGIDLTVLFEAALAKAVIDKKCPYCGQRLVPEKDSENKRIK